MEMRLGGELSAPAGGACLKLDRLTGPHTAAMMPG